MICALQIYTFFFRKIATTVSVNGLIHCEVSIFLQVLVLCSDVDVSSINQFDDEYQNIQQVVRVDQT